MKKRNAIIAGAGVLAILLIVLILCFAGGKGKILVSVPDGKDGLRQQLQTALQKEDWKVEFLSAKDQAEQIAEITQKANKGCSGIVVELMMTEGAQELITLAQEKNIPIVFLNNSPEENLLSLWEKAGFVGTDEEEYAKLLGELASEKDYNADGVVSYGVITGPEGAEGIDRFLNALEETLGEKGERLSVSYTEGNKESALKETDLLLRRFGKDLEALLYTQENLCIGGWDSILESGRTVGEDLFVFTVGKGENVSANAVSDEEKIAEKTAQMLKNMENPETEKSIRIPPITITAQ